VTVARFDDPNLDLIEHARAVARGDARMNAQARTEMLNEVGEADELEADRALALRYLAERGVRV
jgi:hypothetical protein